ncbi:putative short-chain dehydrogenases/reductase [Cryphonectria parasitica EP155]|uniref:Short-chain dehydrogenases/reductase n=1 Tax=Cryphonectria parasitica (strain ATCC 38755 / EP155) TaxID=660469 RepID=A0A9P4YCS8_CRYP1|nr:putative short-chain dehydrogenases/reductase [Cryphonectria parasitica EP155]KAF3771159.1 putative short-chain dehydrogenases/reductase [Cryphonectria parasitica EP155]
MPELSTVQASNASLATSLPAGLVAVFVGATSGIGEYALKAFVKETTSPKVYFVGRTQADADRVVADLRKLNRQGTYIFIRSDVALLKNVNDVCAQILAKQEAINLLFMTQGTMAIERTAEGLAPAYVLPITSRVLFILNLLPALQNATELKRVVSVFAAGFEGPYDDKDWANFPVKNLMKSRPHLATMITLAHSILARRAPDISFVHDFPGAVKTAFGKDAKGRMAVVRNIFNFIGHFVIKYLPPETSGALQIYNATSSRFPPARGGADGVPLSKGVKVARGIDGKLGSGVYSVNENCDDVSLEIDRHIAKAKADGAEESLWAHLTGEIQQHTGKNFD